MCRPRSWGGECWKDLGVYVTSSSSDPSGYTPSCVCWGCVCTRVMLATVLAAHGIKDEETLQLKFAGDGLSKGVMVRRRRRRRDWDRSRH